MGSALMWLAGGLLAMQGLVIYADMVMETLFLDEVLSFAINAALVWIIAKQRSLNKKLRRA